VNIFLSSMAKNTHNEAALFPFLVAWMYLNTRQSHYKRQRHCSLNTRILIITQDQPPNQRNEPHSAHTLVLEMPQMQLP
jgi:hypothetical protein